VTMKTFRTCLLLLPAVLLAACDGAKNADDAPLFADSAVIATRAPLFTSGAVSLIDTTAPFTARNTLAPSATSDLFVRSGGDHYFVVKRFDTNQVLRYAASNPATPVYTYSTQDATDGTVQSNPSDLLIVSDTKAYLLRYGSGKLWIVNPSAATEAAFKIGEIDLSAYDVDGVPEMTAGIVRNGRLYVAMQRLESFASVKTGYVAVIDIATNTEIDTAPTTDGLKGIELPVRDPVSLVGIPGGNNILVLADGGYGGEDDGYAQLYEGGIVRIDTAANSATLVFDDGDAVTHPFDFFADIATVTSDRAYFIGSTGFGATQTLYRFNPNTSAAPVAVPGFQAVAMGSLAVDPNGKLWVTRTSDTQPGVSILGFTSGAETVDAPLIDTVLTPINVDFITVPML